jgi:hypothetical protein
MNILDGVAKLYRLRHKSIAGIKQKNLSKLARILIFSQPLRDAKDGKAKKV